MICQFMLIQSQDSGSWSTDDFFRLAQPDQSERWVLWATSMMSSNPIVVWWRQKFRVFKRCWYDQFFHHKTLLIRKWLATIVTPAMIISITPRMAVIDYHDSKGNSWMIWYSLYVWGIGRIVECGNMFYQQLGDIGVSYDIPTKLWTTMKWHIYLAW